MLILAEVLIERNDQMNRFEIIAVKWVNQCLRVYNVLCEIEINKNCPTQFLGLTF